MTTAGESTGSIDLARHGKPEPVPAAVAQADNPKLVAVVGTNDAFVISLRDGNGNAVTQLAPGTYDIAVSDRSESHNFHLKGPGVDQSTPIEDDHQPFLHAGVPAVDLIDPDYPEWHLEGDTLDKVSPGSLQAVGEVLMAALPDIEKRLSKRR